MKVAIAGATGFIGKGLTSFLLKEGHSILVLSRNVERAESIFGNSVQKVKFPSESPNALARVIDGSDAIINLSGENIGSSIWTKNKKVAILTSRVQPGKLITESIRLMKKPPQVLVQASAVGFYGTRGDEILTESSDAGDGFLSRVAIEWEKSTAAVETSGVRCIIIRNGLVLSSKGGAFPKIALPYKLHLGTMLGTGKQWIPWIHYNDEISAIYFLITRAECNGIYNLVAPEPAQMKTICDLLGTTILKVPPLLLKNFLGKMAEETILASQRVIPERLLKENFKFEYTRIEEAIGNLYGRRHLFR
jgi:uncharacterized protein (TIGR01777 family)